MRKLKILSIIERYKEIFILPFKENIPCYLEVYQSQITSPSRIIKYMKRYLFIILKRKFKNKKDKISDSYKKILCINKSTPSKPENFF